MVDLSIIIPAYNVEKTIEQTLISIFNQSVSYEYEVICVLGPSEDKTKEIVNSFTKEHANLILVDCPFKNALKARLEGVKKAEGRYITFCDGDDKLKNGAINVIVNEMDESESDMLQCAFYFVKKNKTRITVLKKNKTIDQIGFYKYLLRDMTMRGFLWNKTFKSEVLKKSNVIVPSMNLYREDTYLLFSIGKNINKVTLIKEPLYYYNKVDESNFSGASKERVDSFIKVLGYEKWVIANNGNKKLKNFYNYLTIRRWAQLRIDLWLNKEAYDKKEYCQKKKEIRKWLKILRKKEMIIESMPWEQLIKPYLKEGN